MSSTETYVGFCDLKGIAREPYTRFYIQHAFLELQEAIGNSLSSVQPRQRRWRVNAERFVQVLHVTFWPQNAEIDTSLRQHPTGCTVALQCRAVRRTDARNSWGRRRAGRAFK
jgi:hypothetical protein